MNTFLKVNGLLEINYTQTLDCLGLFANEELFDLSVCYKIFNLVFYVFVAYYMFSSDRDVFNDEIYLRVNKQKWFFIRLFNIFIFTVIIKSIIYILLFFIFQYLEYSILFTFELFLKDLISIIIFEIITSKLVASNNHIWKLIFIIYLILYVFVIFG